MKYIDLTQDRDSSWEFVNELAVFIKRGGFLE